MLQQRVFENYEDMSINTAEFIINYVKQKPNALICFPAGNSPEETLLNLVKAAGDDRVNFAGCTFVSLDEWLGIDRSNPGSCRYFLNKNFFEPLCIKDERIVFFDSMHEKPNGECSRIDRFIAQRGPIDLIMVGIGMNGHIGLNEPGVSFDMYSHVVALDDVTSTVAQKYFKEKTVLQKGITLGLKHLLEADTAILIASGEKKSEVLSKALTGKVDNMLPASIMQLHKNGYIFADKSAMKHV